MAEQRLFIACDIPEDVREEVERRAPRGAFAGARWTPRDNQHLTLRFLGGTPEERIPDLERACATAAAESAPFELSVSGLGVFPGAARARVLWAELAGDVAGLTSLAEALAASLVNEGWPREERRFTPHLTLARFRQPLRLGPLPPVSFEEIPAFTIQDFVLYRSILGRGGSCYQALDRFALA